MDAAAKERAAAVACQAADAARKEILSRFRSVARIRRSSCVSGPAGSR